MPASIDWDRVVSPEPHPTEYEIASTGRIRCPECGFHWLLWPTEWDVDVDYVERELDWSGVANCPRCGDITIAATT